MLIVATPGILRTLIARLERELASDDVRRRPLRVDGTVIGWLDDSRVARLAQMREHFAFTDAAVDLVADCATPQALSTIMERVARQLQSEQSLTAWRDERYGVRETFEARPAFFIERAAARYFGIRTYAAHANGLTRRDGEVHMWFARRSPHKAIDPGKLDNLVGGGIPGLESVAEALVRECWEEAGIPGALAATAQAAGSIEIRKAHPDGLQRETIHVYELWLPAGFTPVNQDGEAVEHRCVDFEEALRLIAGDEQPDVVTLDASLVALDCLLRLGAIAPDGEDYARLRAMVRPGAS